MQLTQDQALERLHGTILEILDAIAAFCAEHDIEWFLDSGTALGAMRHDGFIPWDDDADVGMLRPEWERFVSLAAEEGFVEGFSVHTARDTRGFDGIMAKVFKDGTRFLDRRAVDGWFDQGIFVDVFPYDALLADPAAQRRQLRGARLWTYLLYLDVSGAVNVPHGGALGATERLACAVASPAVHAFVGGERALAGFERSIPGPDDAVTDIYVPLPYELRHPKDTLVPVSHHEFCGRDWPVPADPDAYLTVKFGDWRRLPPEEDRKSHLPVLIDFGDGDVYEGGADASPNASGPASVRPVAPKVSVIVPAYNTGAYFGWMTSSVLDQSYGNVELVLVDDGSDDGTAEACDRLAERDGRVVALHQRNAGTSAARNAGIRAATGDYLTFLDHDDFWFDPLGLESAMAVVATDPVDVVMHHVVRFDDPTQELAPDLEGRRRAREGLGRRVADEGYAEGLLDIIRSGFMVRAVWNKIVRTDLVRDARLLFPEGRRNEDTDWTAGLLEAAGSVRWAARPFCAYRVGHGTAQTAKPITDALVDGLAEVVDRHAAVALDGGCDDAVRHALLAYLAYPYIVWLGQAEAIGRGPGDPTFESMRRWARPLFGAPDDPKVRPAALCYRALGLDATAKLLSLAFRRLHPTGTS